MKKKLASIIIMAIFVLSSTVAFAASTKIEASLAKMKLYFNNKQISGNVITANGRSYIPLSILKDLGLSANVNAKTGIISITGNKTTNNSSASPITNLKSKIQVGNYVQFGHYYGKPILWKCVDKSNGVMLVSEYILCLKAFDAAESGKPGEGYPYGSNDWKNSNIREWLNSTEAKVRYTTQPPTKEALSNGYNAYANEAGFLNIKNFSKDETNKIKKIKHEGGIEDSAYLLSMDEVYKYFGTTNEKRKKQITDTGTKMCKYDYEYENNDYWTRDYAGLESRYGGYIDESLHFVRMVDYSGCAEGRCAANNGAVGVLPALNLNSDSCQSGNGTKTKPYIVK